MKDAGKDWHEYFDLLKSGPSEARKDAVDHLITAGRQNDDVIDELVKAIEEWRSIVYGKTPQGVRTGEHEKYLEIVSAATITNAAVQALLGIVGPERILNESRFIELIDSSGMLSRLGRWEEHVTSMVDEGIRAANAFNDNNMRKEEIREVRIFGLGGSGAPYDIAAEIISSYRKSKAEIRVIHADSPNPDYVSNQTLAVFASFSGNTEETINCYEVVRKRAGGSVLVARGGQLRELARRDNVPFIQLPENPNDAAYVLQPRESVCLQLTAILSFLASLGLPAGSNGRLTIDDLEIPHILKEIRRWNGECGPQIPFSDNIAKSLAFFLLYGLKHDKGQAAEYNIREKRSIFVLSDRNSAALAHEVRAQLHERSKLNAAFYDAPEFLHNLVESMRSTVEAAQAGVGSDPWVYYFIRSEDDEERIGLRLDKTIDLVLEGKGSYAEFRAEGRNPYHRALGVVYFNAYLTTYLAILNGHDPLPVPTMSWLKNVMGDIPRNSDNAKARSIDENSRLRIHSPLRR